MKDYSCIGKIKLDIDVEDFIETYACSTSYDFNLYYRKLDILEKDTVFQCPGPCGTHILLTNKVCWHEDFDAVCNLLVLKSDQHIIQDKTHNNKSNRRVLHPGDVVRLDIAKTHRLISFTKEPDFFIALCVDNKRKERFTSKAAIQFFRLLLLNTRT